ncbi:unnamed protein product [Vicia faba]|uniref:Transmembrane protein n=1 Tax=Vicia faba TaxID=3906 RepID=A0AAV0YIA3_VICFA|nr:unnamed protein product [Vicia faba]
MGLNSRDIKLHVFKVLHLSIEKSYDFMKKHPRISGAMLVFFIMYIFLSCIYNLLVFLSPFLVFTAILVTLFWSSEQTHIKCVEKKEKEKKVDAKNLSNVYTKDRRGMLYKYPSQNATSRRRNFTGKKLDVYGDLEQKAKNLSAVFRNEFTKKNTDIRSGKIFFDKEMDPYFDSKFTSRKIDVPLKQTLHVTQPSMVDLVTCNTSYYDCQETNIEKTEEEKKAIEDSSIGNNKGVELKEDDKKKLMDLGICEMERNKRLESLIARRRARKQLNLEIENGLIDIESITPNQISPLLVARMDPFDSLIYFEGIEMPGSAPSTLRSPFDIPYEPFEEKPNLKGDILDHEFTTNTPLEPKYDLLQLKEHRLPSSRVRRLSGLANHDGLEKLNSLEGCESKLQAPNPSNEGEETTHDDKGKCKLDIVGMQSEEENKNDPTITNIEEVIDLTSNPQDEFLDFPLSSTNVTNLNDSLYESLATPVFKSNENVLFTTGLIRHAHSCSLASDLQVEFSEIGSPTLTVDDSHEDMWGANESCDLDVLEPNNWREVGSSSFSLRYIDEENGGELNFRSLRSDMRDDTPTYTMCRDHNIFGNARQMGVSQYSSNVLARWKRLMRLMDTRVNQSPHEMLSEEQEEFNQIDNLLNKQQISNEVNDSEATNQDNTNDLRSNEEAGASVTRQEAPDEISTITNSSSSSSSPTSVFPIPHPTTADQEIHTGVQQSNMEDVAYETVNGDGLLDSMPQNVQLSVDYSNVESHNSDLDNSQVQFISPMVESSSEIHIENEGKSQESLTEEASMKPFINFETIDTNFGKDFEEKRDGLNENETENHSSKEENYLQSESNQIVNNHVENEPLDKDEDICEDSSLPIFIDGAINDDDTLGENENTNKNETTDQELERDNQIMVLSQTNRETD